MTTPLEGKFLKNEHYFMQTINTEQVKNYLLSLQQSLCKSLAEFDSKSQFTEDSWQHENGGGGITRTISNGRVFEKGGINFSHVRGNTLPASASAMRPELAGSSFEAMGVSMIMHPLNPYAPTMHMNVRLFSATKKDGEIVWWFGGGFDLTPFYGFTEDCIEWHRMAYDICAPYGEGVYPRFKKWCDDYFYLKHRKEPRGIGGLFFDDLNEWEFARCFEFMQSVGNGFLPTYLNIVDRHCNTPYGAREREFQSYRHGRYVEFNLVYDRGTLFGLQSGGRTESILVSLPAHVSWVYQWQPAAGSPEEKLTQFYLVPRDWLALEQEKDDVKK